MTSHSLSTAFLDLSLPFHCLSLTFHCLSLSIQLPFLDLPLTFPCPFAALSLTAPLTAPSTVRQVLLVRKKNRQGGEPELYAMKVRPHPRRGRPHAAPPPSAALFAAVSRPFRCLFTAFAGAAEELHHPAERSKTPCVSTVCTTKTLPFLDLTLPFIDVPLPFLDLSTTFVDLSTALPLPFHCLSLTFSLPFIDPFTVVP